MEGKTKICVASDLFINLLPHWFNGLSRLGPFGILGGFLTADLTLLERARHLSSCSFIDQIVKHPIPQLEEIFHQKIVFQLSANPPPAVEAVDRR